MPHPSPARTRVRVLLAILALGSVTPVRAVAAHEIAEAAATVVVRDERHVELRLTVPWADVLHRRMMPTRTRMEFLQRVVSGPTAEIAAAIAAVQAEVERGTRLRTDGAGVAFTHWRWPSTREVRDAMRTELMSRMAGDADTHPSRLLSTAEAISGNVPAARLSFGRALGPVLLTVVRPREEWVPPDRASSPLCPASGQRPGCG